MNTVQKHNYHPAVGTILVIRVYLKTPSGKINTGKYTDWFTMNNPTLNTFVCVECVCVSSLSIKCNLFILIKKKIGLDTQKAIEISTAMKNKSNQKLLSK